MFPAFTALNVLAVGVFMLVSGFAWYLGARICGALPGPAPK